jgi:hypothetical protein
MQNYIPDGYTESGYIKAATGLYGEFRFKYRPMLQEEKDAILEAVEKKGAIAKTLLLAQSLQARITEWDLTDNRSATPKPVLIQVDNVRRLRPALFNRLFWIVAGIEASDPDPKAAPAEVNKDAEDHLQAAIEGRSIGAVKSEGDQKNSVAG